MKLDYRYKTPEQTNLGFEYILASPEVPNTILVSELSDHLDVIFTKIGLEKDFQYNVQIFKEESQTFDNFGTTHLGYVSSIKFDGKNYVIIIYLDAM